MHDAKIEQVGELFAFARSIHTFSEGFAAVAGRISSDAQEDESLARHYVSQIRRRMEEAADEPDYLQRQLERMAQEDPETFDRSAYNNLLHRYEDARREYENAARAYNEAEQRFQQLRQLISQMTQVANHAATQIVHEGNEARNTVERAATIISEEYGR